MLIIDYINSYSTNPLRHAASTCLYDVLNAIMFDELRLYNKKSKDIVECVNNLLNVAFDCMMKLM